MIAIIENNKVHSIYNDDKAKILFNKYSLSELEYITYEIERGQTIPPDSKNNELARGLAYSVLTDPLYIHDYRKGGNTTYKTEADAIVEQIKNRWPE